MNWKLCLGLGCVAMVAGQAAVAPLKVELVSAPPVRPGQTGAGNGTSTGPILSGDGRIVAFTSDASNLSTNIWALGIPGGFLNVYARELQSGVTHLVSVNQAGTNGGNGNSFLAEVSREGRYVLFESDASNLVANDSNGARDVFVRDLVRGVTMHASVNAAGEGSGNGESASASISRDGRYVVFESDATNLVAGDTNGLRDVFVRDLVDGITTLVSRATDNVAPGNGAADTAAISADGRLVLFRSSASNLAAGDTNKLADLFVRDLAAGITTNLTGTLRAFTLAGSESYQFALGAEGRHVVFRAGDGYTLGRNPDDGVIYWWDLRAATNVVVAKLNTAVLRGELEALDISADGGQVIYASNGSIWRWNAVTQVTEAVATNGLSLRPVMTSTSDGRWVAYLNTVINPVSGAPVGDVQILLRDLATNSTRLVSVRPDGSPGVGNDIAIPSLSDDGRWVAFDSLDARLAPGDVNRTYDVFIRDVGAGVTIMASTARPGISSTTGDGMSRFEPAAVSVDGRFLIYSSSVETLVANDTNGFGDIFLFDRDRGTNLLVSVDLQGAGSANGISSAAILSANGQVTGFFSTASNLTADKTDNATDFYVRDLARGVTRRIDPTRLPGSDSTGITLPALSGDGKYLAFASGDTVYRLDLVADTITTMLRVGSKLNFAFSGDGRWIALSGNLFSQQLWDATTGKVTRIANLSPATAFDSFRFAADGGALFYSYLASGLYYQVVAVDLPALTQTTISLNLSGKPQASIAKPDLAASADGNFVAFVSTDGKLTAGDTNKLRDVFVRDRRAGTNILVSVNATGTASGNGVSDNPRISADGRYVLFRSDATDLVPGEAIPAAAIFLRDLQTGVTRLVSRNFGGTGGSSIRVSPPSLSADGSTAYFASFADDLVADDGNAQQDVFFVRLGAGTAGLTDSDGDGLPDDWERQFFGDLTRDGSGDFDADGFSDRDELGAGTNPANRESWLRIELDRETTGEWSLRWPSVAGKFYRVQYRVTLDGGAWTDVPGETTGDGASLKIALPSVIDDEGRYFRLVVR